MIQVIAGRTRLEQVSVSTAPGNAPISKGRKLTRHEGGTDKAPIEPNPRYEAKVKQENEDKERRKQVDSLIEANDFDGIMNFLEKLSVYKKCFIKKVFEYTKNQIVDSGFPDDTKKEILELIHKVI